MLKHTAATRACTATAFESLKGTGFSEGYGLQPLR